MVLVLRRVPQKTEDGLGRTILCKHGREKLLVIFYASALEVST